MSAYLADIAGLAKTALPDFDREQWTTTGIGLCALGDVVLQPRAEDERPTIITSYEAEEIPGEEYDWVLFTLHCAVTGDQVGEYKLRANRSLPIRCDLRYLADDAGGQG